ncbi:MAG: hypothetical protein K8J08_07050 [Thermoanaerobaculia bacterium]|nr:hypothetical protein [Thermoanaerobaculia bacterium]
MLNILLVLLVTGVVVLAALVFFGSRRWSSETRELRAQLEAARLPVRPGAVDFRELEGLPTPVQRFFRVALTDGQPMVTAVRVRHRGTFNMSETADQWKPFASDQQIVTQRPGFDWNGRIEMLPGLPVRVHDAYIAGEGLLHASLFGILPLAKVQGADELAEGELMRFLAEATWYPTVLLPSQAVHWEPVDDRSAHATLTDGGLAVTLLFTFGDSGLVESVHAEKRGRMVDGETLPTPWQGRFWNYSERSGMQVPSDGEVAWLLPAGAKPYWRGRITEITYDFSPP